jgi:hypothetical protein
MKRELTNLVILLRGTLVAVITHTMPAVRRLPVKLTLALAVLLIVTAGRASAVVVTPNGTRTETFNTAGTSEFVDVNSPHANGQNFGFSNTNFAGGTAGEAGGTFARTQSADAYADIDLTGGAGDFDRTKNLALSGKFTITGSSNPDNSVFVGYLNDNLGVGSLQFVGLIILDPSGPNFRGEAWIRDAAGNNFRSNVVGLPLNTDFTFSLTYAANLDGSGTLSGTIAGTAVTISAGASTDPFDKFGIGAGFNGSDDASLTMDVFFDDLTYDIYTAPVPEPAGLTLAIIGMVAVVGGARRSRARS